LSLIVVMSSLAVLYLLLGAEFLAIAQIIVYAGAVMVLFTFVVMLLNVGEEERTNGSKVARVIGFPAIFVFFAVVTTVILEAQRRLGGVKLSDGITTTQELSKVLFTDMLLPFELTSVLVLIAILGAVALARKEGHS
jgi:NADH-quinone oxidoreductase subunit J